MFTFYTKCVTIKGSKINGTLTSSSGLVLNTGFSNAVIINKEGIVVFDMYVKVGTNTGKLALIENLSTEFNNIPQNLDAYLLKEYEDGSLVGNMQFSNGEVQSGYFKYNGTRYYLVGKYEEAIAKLVALDTIEGYEDGTFKPENTITRAELATVITFILGLQDAADLAKDNPTRFSNSNRDNSSYIIEKS